MQIQSPLRAEGANARGKRTDQLADSSVDHQKVVDHPLVSRAVDAADRTYRLSLVELEVIEEMRPECVVDDFKVFEADAARFRFRVRRVVLLDLDVRKS